MNGNWTTGEYHLFLKNGTIPERFREGAGGAVTGAPDNPRPATRNKYGAQRCEADGIRFDSKVERDYYLLLKEQPAVAHIDVHPFVSLPGGIRKAWDFLVWWYAEARAENGFRIEGHYPEFIDVKGRDPSTDDRRMIALHRASHPVPLRIVQRKKGEWVEWNP